MVSFKQRKQYDVERETGRTTDAPPAAFNFLAKRTLLCRFLFAALIFWFFFIKKKEREKEGNWFYPQEEGVKKH